MSLLKVCDTEFCRRFIGNHVVFSLRKTPVDSNCIKDASHCYLLILQCKITARNHYKIKKGTFNNATHIAVQITMSYMYAM